MLFTVMFPNGKLNQL